MLKIWRKMTMKLIGFDFNLCHLFNIENYYTIWQPK